LEYSLQQHNHTTEELVVPLQVRSTEDAHSWWSCTPHPFWAWVPEQHQQAS